MVVPAKGLFALPADADPQQLSMLAINPPTAALLLSRDKDQATLDALEDALIDKDFRVRAAAVHSLALRNDPALRIELAPLVADDKQEVRLRAAAALLRLSAIPAIKKPVPKR